MPSKIFSTLLLLISFAGVSAQNLIPCNETINLGRLLPSDSISYYVEYPVYKPLTRVERQELKETSFIPRDEIQFEADYGLSRGERVAHVSFLPVVIKDGQPVRLVDYVLRYRVHSKVKSTVHREAVQLATRVMAANRYADKSVLASGRWVKIRVSQEGIYQLSSEQLEKMGFKDPARVKLYGYGGRLLPDLLQFEGNDAVIDDLCEQPVYRRGSDILFFCEGVVGFNKTGRVEHNTFSNYSYYFLTEGDNPATINQIPTTAARYNDVNEVKAHALYDNDKFVWYGGGRDFYDDRDLRNTVTETLSLPGCTNAAAQLFYDVSAASATSSTTIRIALDGKVMVNPRVTQFGEGESARGYRGSFQFSPNEQATFTIQADNASRLNYLHALYTQQLSAAHTFHAFSPERAGAVNLKIASADENLRVWQIGTAFQPLRELPGTLNNGTLEAKAEDGMRRFVLVNLATKYPSPETVGEISNQNLHADRNLDYVIILPTSGRMNAQAERLADLHREKSGLRVKVVSAGQIYNEFSSGTPDFMAYRRYMKMLYDRALSDNDRPRYLLFFGDCTYDNRMVTSDWAKGNPDDYLLASERNDQERYNESGYSIGTLQSYVTDDHVGYLDDGEGKAFPSEMIDLGIGRFLCHTEEDAAWLVDQAVRYLSREQAGVWQNRMWAIADVGDNNLHMNDAQKVTSEVERAAGNSFFLRRLYPDVYEPTQEARGLTYPEATRKLKMTMEQGALIFNYNGHGSPFRISHKFFLEDKDLSANRSNSMPLWIFASCEITPYDQIISDLGRRALFNKEGAAVALLCASRSVYANYNCYLNRGFIKYAFDRQSDGVHRNTMGDALRLAKCALVTDKSSFGNDYTINKMKYVLLGDPALSLDYPDQGVTIDSINGYAVTDFSLTTEIPVGRKVTFSGYVNGNYTSTLPDETFNGTLIGTAVMPMRKLTCKGTSNSNANPLTFNDYTQVMFEGNVIVKNGRFNLSFIVPRGATFSKDRCLLSLYTMSDDRKRVYNGSFRNFNINGSAPMENPDTVGPNVYVYLNHPDFPDGGRVESNAVFYANVNDSSAINMMTGNLGHDMEFWLDNDLAASKLLNDYFIFNPESYSEGTVSYELNNLAPGSHRLHFRVWDVFDNSTTASLSFFVTDKASEVNGFNVAAVPVSGNSRARRFVTSCPNESEMPLTVTTEVYSLSGTRLWHSSGTIPAGGRYYSVEWDGTNYGGAPVPRGVYLYRSRTKNDETKSHKIVIS